MSWQGSLKVEKIGKTIHKKRVVRDVSLEVKPGEIVGLLGPNGAGKTTTFYMIAGLTKPDFGEIFLDDHNVTSLPVYKRSALGLGYLPQESSIFRGLTVEQNIKAILEIHYDKEEIEGILEQLLADFNISHLSNVSAMALSGGERRRTEFARCAAINPKYILLDEPFAGVDPISAGEIIDYLFVLKNKGIGLLITDHNINMTLKVINRGSIMHEGVVIAEGEPEELKNNELVRDVYWGDAV